ncbi:MAG: hypothetical protein AB1457_18400 [Chloroflexota bacterium]
MDLIIAKNDLPIRWHNQDYRLISAGVSGGVAFAETQPANMELAAEIKAHLLNFQALKVLWREGYIELIE